MQVLVGVFQRQAWSRLAEDMRLGILEANEQRSAFRFEVRARPATRGSEESRDRQTTSARALPSS